MKKIILSLLLVASIYSAGLDPNNDYREIKGENARVIYPIELKNEADEILSFIDYQNENNRTSVEGQLLDIPIILHKDTTIPNAYVTQGPFRSEFFMTPPNDLYGLGITPWHIDLAIHEYRHALQMMQGREGINKLIYVLGGELTVGAANVLAIPTWYWEGDAVAMETAITNGGRGRLNYFLKGYKRLLLEEEAYSYEKAKNRSYIDPVPNHYVLGYMLVAYGREIYGNEFWKGIFTDATGYKGFLPLSDSINVRTGLSSTEFYIEAMKWWKEKWQKEEKSWVKYEALVEVDNYTQYSKAFPYKDGIVTSKSSYSDLENFVYINGSEEEKIRYKGIGISDTWSQRGSYIVWSNFAMNKFWDKVEYSDIYIYDINNGEEKRLTEGKRYFAPSISNGADKIAAVEVEAGGRSRLTIFDIDGRVLEELDSDKWNYVKAVWGEEDRVLYTVASTSKGEIGLLAIDIVNGKEEVLIPFGNYILESPYYYNNSVYFSATFDSVDNIYSVDIGDKEIKKVTNTRFGAYEPSIVNNELVFVEYGKDGYLLKKTNRNNNYEFDLKELEELEVYNFDWFMDEGGSIMDKVEVSDYEDRSYSFNKNLLNIHSWSYSYLADTLDITVMSTNETTDLSLIASYSRDTALDEDKISLGAVYERFWPSLSLTYTKEERLSIDENQFTFGMNFPIDLTSGMYYKKFEPKLRYEYSNKLIDISSVGIGFDYYRTTGGALQNLGARWSETLSLDYIKGLDQEAERLLIDGSIGFKGVFDNDAIKLAAALEVEDSSNEYLYSDEYTMPRGYSSFERDSIYKATLDYSVPLFYPDFGNYGFYLKRVRTNLFYDKGLFILNDIEKDIDSYGVEVYFDTRLLSLTDFTFGFRYSYRLLDDEVRYDFLIPMQLY